ncbi:MAG TPA: hypothetical protein VJN95_11370 [Gemmatimonadales bacterium]|nr:hypothetical protein [Gemmatimonadales bacterium]
MIDVRRLKHAVVLVGSILLASTIITCAPPEVSGPANSIKSLYIAVSADTLEAGHAQQITALGVFANGDTAATRVAWSATGGTISPDGVFLAGPAAGSYKIIASQQAGALADTVTITVVQARPPLAPPAHSYSSSFPLTENPISEGGIWLNGGSVGQSWSNVSTTPGLAVGRETGASYTDATAILTGTWSADQQVTATVYAVSPRDACYQELELRLRSSLAARSNRGYEIGFKSSTTSSAYLIIVRWNGALGNFTILMQRNGAQYGVKTGDVISAKIVGSVISAYKNGVLMGSVTDKGISSGAPGMGFNLENGPTGCRGTNGNYGYTSYSAVDVAPAPPALTQVILTPAAASIPAGLTQQFAVSGRLSDGTTTTPAVNYAVTGGSITTAGLYTAGATLGTYQVIATQQGGTLADTSAITITPPVLTQLSLTPATASVPAGLTRQFAVSGLRSDGSTVTPAVTWSATGGTISAGGLYTAGNTPGSFQVIAVQQGGTLADTSTITVTPAVLTQVILNPPTAAIPAGLAQQFSVSGAWSDGTSSAPAVDYTATGGTVTAAGLYTAGTTPGTYRVIATQQGGTPADTSAVTVTAAVYSQMTVAPAATSVPAGLTQQFSAAGTLSDGSTGTPVVTWSATGGTITPEGLFTAGATPGPFQVTATLSGGTLTANAAVTVGQPILVSLSVLPGSAALTPGQQSQFSASGHLSDGTTTTPPVTWTATGGSITSGGLYTAGIAEGNWQVTATAQGGVLTASAAVGITGQAVTLTRVRIAPATADVPAGEAQQFSATGDWSDGSSKPLAVTWSGTGGSITAGGLYTAGSTTGTYRVIATDPAGTLADTAAVTVTNAVLTQITVSPGSASIAAGLTRQFSAAGHLSDGAVTTPTVNWSATGGSITPDGVFTAGATPGSYQVTATDQSGTLTASATVTVTAPVLTQLAVIPASATVHAGLTQQFTVSGTLSDGSTVTPAVTWSATGGNISPQGLYTAGATLGPFQVTATQAGSGLSASAAVTIAPALITSLDVTPGAITLAPGAAQQFTASARMSDGSLSSPQVVWSATGGAVTADGGYTAGTTSGAYQVTASLPDGSLAAHAAVTISPPAPTLTQIVLSPASATLLGGATRQFTATGIWSDGSSTTPAVVFTATGGTISAGGLYTAGLVPGSYQVTATLQGGTLAGSAPVTVNSGRVYASSFPLAESRISEGGNWIGGFTPGVQWSDVQTIPGLAFGRQQIDRARSYSDGTALLTGPWGPDQQATATVYSAGPAPENYYEEVELRLRSTITPNSSTGYEIDWKISSSSAAYLVIVRWNGPWGNFTYLPGGGTGAQWGVKNGDVVTAKIVGNVISVYKNGVLVTTSTDNTYTSGSPGMGFNLEAPGAGHNQDYGFTTFAATDRP